MSLDCHYFHMNVGIGARTYALIILYDNIAVGYFVPLLELAFSEGAGSCLLSHQLQAVVQGPQQRPDHFSITFISHFH